ncbi:sporulation protein YpeB [Clostridium tepidiprofundi DSM 19306]|uniref:Sporulation protein YpeB n=1 Tax=Clostridium tepidiprofundi DSM 19306 TaxID=1121338 RepID=A0A151B5L0_9CLOT|nr:germination protein YpeB [Clostridium tepidiprofundi]KYH34937.1 sporulation protein YpeB [Clostridium tepidiprofundi DSM 19306]
MKTNMTKKRIVYTCVVTLIVVFTTTFAILMTLERTDYRNYLQGQYSKNMYDLINSVQNIRSNLSKSAIIGSSEQNIIVFSEIFRYASIANDKLHSLPISQEVLGDTSAFLSRVGDFCYSLAASASKGKELTDADYNKIDMLEEESFQLEAELNKVLSDINEGNVKWGEIRKKVTGVFAKTSGEKQISKKFEGIQKQIAQYPALIYDGPFSDNVQEIKPRILKQKKISQHKASEIVKYVLGKEKISNIKVISSDGKTNIPSYRFNVNMKNRKKNDSSVICEVSKNGGRIVYLLDNKTITNPKISEKEALKIGKNFLERMGYKNMVSTYTLNYKKYEVINYVYNQNGIMVYPDQIKLKIALDDGEIIGVEAEKYLTSHIDNRKISEPTITKSEAYKKVGKRLKINSVKLAIVPTETNKEVLCYEFAGQYKGKNFIVYINAQTGHEQKIIEIINTPNGKLTI